MSTEVVKAAVEIDKEDPTDKTPPRNWSAVLNNIERQERTPRADWKSFLSSLLIQMIRRDSRKEYLPDVQTLVDFVLDAFRQLSWRPDDPYYRGMESFVGEIDAHKHESPYWHDYDAQRKESDQAGLTESFVIESQSPDQPSILPHQLLEILAEEIEKSGLYPGSAEALLDQARNVEAAMRDSWLVQHEKNSPTPHQLFVQSVELIPGIWIDFIPKAPVDKSHTVQAYKVSFRVDRKTIAKHLEAESKKRFLSLFYLLKSPMLVPIVRETLDKFLRSGDPLPASFPLQDIKDAFLNYLNYPPNFVDFEFMKAKNKLPRNPNTIEDVDPKTAEVSYYSYGGFTIVISPAPNSDPTRTELYTLTVQPIWDQVRKIRLQLLVKEIIKSNLLEAAENGQELMDVFFTAHSNPAITQIEKRLFFKKGSSPPEVSGEPLQRYIQSLMPNKVRKKLEADLETQVRTQSGMTTVESKVTVISVGERKIAVTFQAYRVGTNGTDTLFGLKKVDQSKIETQEQEAVPADLTPIGLPEEYSLSF